MYAYKDLLELAGLTTRLYQLLSTLHHLPALPDFGREDDAIEFKHVIVAVPGKEFEAENEKIASIASSVEERQLVKDLNLRIGKGEHLMISGPVRIIPTWTTLIIELFSQNGVGKSAVARVLAGLWAAEAGSVSRPERGVKGVFVVPQRPYMVAGTLRDQCGLSITGPSEL